MMSKELVSIIIPIYNLENNCKYCFESLMKQSYSNLEFIIINDGSTDGSLKICEEYCKKDKRFKVYSQKNSGSSAARNLGIEKATGKFISFCDGDDIEAEHCIEVLLNNFTCDSCVTMCEFKRIFTYDNFPNPVTNEVVSIKGTSALEKIIDGKMRISVCGAIFKKDMMGSLRFNTELRNNEDKLFLFEYVLRNKEKKVKIINEEHYGYYVREGSITKSIPNVSVKGFVDSSEIILQLVKKEMPNLLLNAQNSKSVAIINFLKNYHRYGITIDDKYKEYKNELLNTKLNKKANCITRVEYFSLLIGDWTFAILVKLYYFLMNEKMQFKRNEINSRIKG